MSDEQGKTTDGGKKPPRLSVVALPVKREVSEKHLEGLRASGLTDETITAAQLYTESRSAELAQLVGRRTWPRVCGAALVFPFILPGETEPYAYRVRPTIPRVTGHKRDGSPKHAKYDQATEHGVLTYFPPRARAAGDFGNAQRTLYWTEGEKKALVLDQLGLACVGLTGVWNYADVEHKDETGERLHPRIRDSVAIAGRAHVIVFDADARSNDQVMLAAGRLAGVLMAAGAASVRFVTPLTAEQKGIDDYFARFGEDVTRQLLDSAEPIEPVSPQEPLSRIRSIKGMQDAPVDPDLRLPLGYALERDGTLWRLGDDRRGDAKVARAPIFIQRYLDDHYTGEGRVELCFERDGRWQTSCVSRKAIVDGRTMVADLSSFGAPVTSNNAGAFVDWFDDLERVNAGRIPRVACVGRAGWHDIDGRRVFVLDDVLVSGDEVVALALDTRGDRKKLFGSLKSRGDAAAHIAALRRAWEADAVCAAMIAGSLAAPLLEQLGAPNFAIHVPGDSSRGKTSMLKIAASVFGDPNSDHWVSSWNITSVAAELRAAVFTGLPQAYDEVGASDPEATERLVYMLINGGGRARGQRDLTLRETPSWHTVVLSTGERGLADESAATGAQIRVIQLPVSRFGELGAEAIDALREECATNAGAFGREWIAGLLDIDDWAPWRAQYKDYVKLLRAKATDPLRGRLAGYFAVLCVAEAMAAQLGFGDPDAATMQRLFAAPARREQVQSLAERARDMVLGWALSEQDAFPELRLVSSGDEEPQSTRGARARHGFRRSGELLFIPYAFRKWCEEHRLSYREVLRGWQERGWLVHDPGRLESKVRIGASFERVYRLTVGEDEPCGP